VGKGGAGSRTSKVGTEVVEIAKSTQHCIIFFGRERAKRQEPSEQTWEWELGVKGYGKQERCTPVSPKRISPRI